jgi:hypothetical protein
MEPEENLVASLDFVRGLYDGGDDRWRRVLVGVFRNYLLAIGVDRKLVLPVQALHLELWHEIDTKPRGEKSAAQTGPLAAAAAAVSFLKTKHGVKLQDALDRVAKASGLDRGDIEEQRNRISRGGNQVAKGAKEVHDRADAIFRRDNFSPDDVLLYVTDLVAFL